VGGVGLTRSHADDTEQKRRSLEFLGPIRDRVLANARIRPGEVVLDVGAGDGLIAFGAIPLVGESGRVIFCRIQISSLLVDGRGLIRAFKQGDSYLSDCGHFLTSASSRDPVAKGNGRLPVHHAEVIVLKGQSHLKRG
jgi:hypothetical protein